MEAPTRFEPSRSGSSWLGTSSAGRTDGPAGRTTDVTAGPGLVRAAAYGAEAGAADGAGVLDAGVLDAGMLGAGVLGAGAFGAGLLGAGVLRAAGGGRAPGRD